MYGEPKNFNRFVDEIDALGFTGGQITRFHAPPYRGGNGNLGKFEAVDCNGTVFAPKQCLYQKLASGTENLKIQSLCRCNKLTGLYGPVNHQISCTAV